MEKDTNQDYYRWLNGSCGSDINNHIPDKTLVDKVALIINEQDENLLHGEIGVIKAVLDKHRPEACCNYVIEFDIDEGVKRTLCYIREEFKIVTFDEVRKYVDSLQTKIPASCHNGTHFARMVGNDKICFYCNEKIN